MGKIIDALNERIAKGELFYSFEYFPPKTDEGVANLVERQHRMFAYGPTFCDITWGAGGSTADLTLDIAKRMQNEVGGRARVGGCCPLDPSPNWPPPRVPQRAAPLARRPAQVGMETMMHLTCTNMPVEKLREALDKVRLRGCGGSYVAGLRRGGSAG